MNRVRIALTKKGAVSILQRQPDGSRVLPSHCTSPRSPIYYNIKVSCCREFRHVPLTNQVSWQKSLPLRHCNCRLSIRRVV